nr:hypothetical protein TEA_010062 [Ipomoea trifida]
MAVRRLLNIQGRLIHGTISEKFHMARMGNNYHKKTQEESGRISGDGCGGVLFDPSGGNLVQNLSLGSNADGFRSNNLSLLLCNNLGEPNRAPSWWKPCTFFMEDLQTASFFWEGRIKTLSAGQTLQSFKSTLNTCVAVGADVGAITVHEAGLEIALVGRPGRPSEGAFPHGFPTVPLPHVHAPVGPPVLAVAVREVPRPLPRVVIAVWKKSLRFHNFSDLLVVHFLHFLAP